MKSSKIEQQEEKIQEKYTMEEIKKNMHDAKVRQDCKEFNYWFNLWLQPLRDKGIVE